jgi:hypothetical protein
MAAPLILVEIAPRRPADGLPETVRLAGNGSARPYHHDGHHWRAGIESLPTIVSSLNYDGEIVGGGVTEAMTISWAPAGQAGVDGMAGYFWIDAAITVRFGTVDIDGALPPIVTQGKVTDMATAEGKMAIALADPAVDLMKPLPATRYAGTGDLEGPADWENRIKRRLWGQVWNIEAEPLDAANNIYCLSDPTRPLQAITAVRDRGSPTADLAIVAWAGTAADTLAALRAAVVPQGGGVVCPSIACIKWWAEPSALHADVMGEIGASYVETPAQIAERLVEALDGPGFAAGEVAAAAALRPAPVGWVVNDETTTVAAMLDQMLADNSLMWLLDAGEIIFRPWAWGESVAAAVSQDVARKRSIAPITTRKLGYRRNESPMARCDLAAIVLAQEVAYLDGQLAQSLQPAEAGSTLGAPSGTPVGTISADDVDSTINAGGGVAQDQVDTLAILDNAVTESNFALLDLFGASVGGDDDNIWRNFAYMGVALQTTFTRPQGASDTTAVFLVTVVGARTGGDNDRVSLRMIRGDGTVLLPSEHGYLLFEGGGNTAYTVPFFDAAPLDGTNSYTVQTKNVVGHPTWERGIVIPVRLSK